MNSQFGLDPKQFRFIQERVVRPLELMGAEVWCFGSRATRTHRDFSDLDLMICGADDSIRPLVGQIQESLIESSFPFKVDLVLLQDFACSYRARFESEKVRFPAMDHKHITR